MKKILEDYIENGIIKTLDVHSEKAEMLLIGSELKYVPAFLVNGILCEYSVNTKDDGEENNEVRIIWRSWKGSVDVGLVIKD